MSVAALLAWIVANKASLATILFLLSELLGAVPSVKSNGILSFLIIQAKEFARRSGGNNRIP